MCWWRTFPCSASRQTYTIGPDGKPSVGNPTGPSPDARVFYRFVTGTATNLDYTGTSGMVVIKEGEQAHVSVALLLDNLSEHLEHFYFEIDHVEDAIFCSRTQMDRYD